VIVDRGMTATTTLTINPELKKILESSKTFKRDIVSEGRVKCSIRVSKKQLWFFAYKSMELTGQRFLTEDATGGKGYPTAFLVGSWDDGSKHFAECNENKINGPFWIQYTESFNP